EEDNSDDEKPAGLDEEGTESTFKYSLNSILIWSGKEQEDLIARLRKEDEKRNDMYKVVTTTSFTFSFSECMQRIFLIIPLISATIFLPTLMTSPSPQMRLISLLAISSLLCTAYILFLLPNGKPANVRMNPATFDGQGPIRRYLTYLNGGLGILVGLNAFRFRSQDGVHDGFWLFCVLPSAVFFIVFLARRTMFSVDIEGLEKLKYPYKGA
ncbi:MAG: hypothetical protein Q9210_006915, partial [Variospora velana]